MSVYISESEQAIQTNVSLVEKLESLQKIVSKVFVRDDNPFNGISKIESELIRLLLESMEIEGLYSADEETSLFYAFYRKPNENALWKGMRYESATLYIMENNQTEKESKRYKLLSNGSEHWIVEAKSHDESTNIFLIS